MRKLFWAAVAAVRPFFVIPWFAVTLIDWIAWPLGWQAYVRSVGGPGWHSGRVGAERIYFVRRDPTPDRPKRLKGHISMTLLAAVMLLACAALPALAQDTAVAPSSWLYDVWTIVQPIVTVVGAIVGPVLGTWIAAKIISVLNITDENRRKELERQIRDALHASAANGLRYALAKAGVPSLAPGAAVPPQIVAEAIRYIRTKNPDTIKETGVNDDDLKQIVLSKVPDLIATITAAKAAHRP